MRLCLGALPWSIHVRPSAAVGALAAYVREQQPEYEVACRYDYVNVAFRIGSHFYESIAEDAYALGEMLYTPHLYPEKRDSVRAFFVRSMKERAEQQGPSWAPSNADLFPPELYGTPASWEEIFDRVLAVLGEHLDEVAADLAQRYDVVGLTTCFGQLFANLSLAQKLKALSPQTRLLLGGSTLSAEVGASVLAEYPFVDYVVQGEGETPLLELLRALEAGKVDAPVRGILSRGNAERFSKGAELSETPKLDSLPLPDFDDYAELSERYGFLWLLPIEGSRGCWWDRTKRTGNPKNTCYFCNLNVQWSGYREKSIPRLVQEMLELSERYGNTSVFFLDNIIRAKGITEFAERIRELGRDFVLFYEMRANVHPYDIYKLWQAGVRYVQFGIEGLSTSYLRRIGKGTTAIQNLQVMKLCHELQIQNTANLLTDFPGSIQSEVEETVHNIANYALIYEPLNANRFWMGMGATVDTLRKEFPVTNVRNADFYRIGLPDEVYRRLKLFDRSFDLKGQAADWSGVHYASRVWRESYAAARASKHRHMLAYLDGGSFLRIMDGRSGTSRSRMMRGLERDLYMYCMEIRSWSDILKAFVETGLTDEVEVRMMLEEWIETRLMFREESRYLSLAPAFSPDLAARRLEAAHQVSAQARASKDGQAPRLAATGA